MSRRKRAKNFDDTPLTFKYPEGMKARLIAIAYYMGRKGQHSGVVRDFLEDAITRFEGSLDAKGRARYERILSTVQVSDTMRKAIDQDS